MRKLLTLALTFCCAVSAQAQEPFDRNKAQSAMLMRVQRVIEDYAARIGLGPAYVTYCYSKMDLDTRHEPDGQIPFGFNYRTSSDEQVKLALKIREQFEASYLRLCLADAKIKLDSARKLAASPTP